MKQWPWVSATVFVLALILFFVNPRWTTAVGEVQVKSALRLGGELYDNWYASLETAPPEGNMPLWSRQTSNPASGADTWRCVTCHGWDYQGKDGAYRAGSNFTGFSGVLQARGKDPQAILDQLSGKVDPDHDYSALMDGASLNALAVFISQGVIDDNQFIDPVSLEVLDGNAAAGKGLYDGLCANCHGADGAAIQFRVEGLGTSLGALAVLDPWRFLHKSRFGSPGVSMGKVVGVDVEWTPQQGRDVLLYAQSLPSGLSKATPAGEEVTPGATTGSSPDWLTKILTMIGAVSNTLGLALVVIMALVGFMLLIVWTVRGNRR